MDDILLQKQVDELKEKSKDGEYTIKASLYERDRDKKMKEEMLLMQNSKRRPTKC
jgi:hypothetical protein